MKKILIVDDDADILDLIANRLRRHNYDVISSNNGQNGFQKAVELQPDLIIMDVMMPTMSGGDAVKHLKANGSTRDIPVLFFTALASDLVDDAGFAQINVNGQLYPAMKKPFDPDKLLATIKSLLDG